MGTADQAGSQGGTRTPPAAIDGSFVAAPAASVVGVELDDEAVLLDGATGYLHHLDRVGSIVWACFDGSSTLEEVIGDLGDAFGVEPQAVQAHVLALVRELGQRGVLEGVVRDPAFRGDALMGTPEPEVDDCVADGRGDAARSTVPAGATVGLTGEAEPPRVGGHDHGAGRRSPSRRAVDHR